MGVVYEATQLSLGRKVALKVLTPQLGDDDGFRRRFRREGQLQALIDHPSIVAVHEAGESDEGLFLAMRLVRGRTLKELIAEQALSTARSLRILRPIAEALDAAHEGGLIHRDVKPHNILVGEQDVAYLGDFGLTKAPDDANLTRSGEFLGTPNYISPEQVHGHEATRASDVYALGAVLYQCLTGVVPFPKTSNAAVLFAHVSAEPPAVTGLRPDLPPAIDAVVRRAMAKDPAQRHPSATALLADASVALDGVQDLFRVPAGGVETLVDGGSYTILAPSGTASTRPLGGRTGPTQWAAAGRARSSSGSRRAAVPAAAVVVLAVVVAALAGFLLSRAGDDDPAGPHPVTAGGLRLTVPGDWTTAAVQPELADVELTGETAVAPPSPDGAGLVAGRAKVSGSPPLPVGLPAVVDAVPAPDRVRLAGGEAYRYRGLTLKSSGLALTVYVLPTTAGASVVACHAPAASVAVMATCERAAGSLRPTEGEVVALGPSAAYARDLNAAVRTLDSRRAAGRRALADDGKPAEQAAAARRVGSAFGTARRALGRIEAPAGGAAAHAGVRDALAAGATAYARLAKAADAKSKSRFTDASAAVRRAERDLASSLEAVRRLGYRGA